MSKEETKKILFIGIGNSGRSDDGLGWLMIDYLEKKFEHFDFLYRYQLQIEDAEIISHYSTVIFVDATKEETRHGFYFESCLPNRGIGLTSHLLEPETILWLEKELYNDGQHRYILGIEGKEWELSLKPSDEGLINLQKAKEFISENMIFIHNGKLPTVLKNPQT